MTISVCACCFGRFLGVGDGVCRLLVIFALRDAVDLGRFLASLLLIKSTLICDVSLWEDFCGVVLCLKISASLMIVCSFSSLVAANAAAGYGLEMASIIYSAILVADSLLYSHGILVC